MMRRAAIALAALALAPATASAADVAQLASAAAGRPITVSCDSAMPDAAGYTVVGSSAISITPDRCRAIAAVSPAWLRRAPGGVANADRLGEAIQALVHEAMHLRLASGDEGAVECAASRNYWPTVAALHLPARLARVALRAAIAAHDRIHAAAYRTEC